MNQKNKACLSSPLFSNKSTQGSHFESKARSYLESHGLLFLEANFYCRVGEIDLVMLEKTQDSLELVFVEVRMRAFGRNIESAIESVNFKKLRKIKKAMEFYLQKKEALIRNLSLDGAFLRSVRLDVLGSDGEKWVWVKNQGL